MGRSAAAISECSEAGSQERDGSRQISAATATSGTGGRIRLSRLTERLCQTNDTSTTTRRTCSKTVSMMRRSQSLPSWRASILMTQGHSSSAGCSIYLLAGLQADAEKVLASAFKANPKDVDALLQRAELFLQASRNALSARRDLLQVLQNSPHLPLAHYLLAEAHKALGENQQQRQELGNALRLQPDLLGVRIELAQADLEADHATTALQLLNDAPRINDARFRTSCSRMGTFGL